MTLCVASSAGTDISVGAIMALSGAVSVYLLGSGETYAIPWIAAILIGLVVSVLCGMWNGFLVANMKNLDLIYRRTRNGTVDHRWK